MVSGSFLDGVWKVSGRCLEECMQGMKMVFRQYKDGIKTINRECFEANLQFQLGERS